MSDDLIKRSDAIEPLKRVMHHGAKDKDGAHPISAELVLDHLMSLPSVDRPQGQWIKRFGSINCSVCKHSNWSDSFEDLLRSFNYCPNCGARMKGANNENRNETV